MIIKALAFTILFAANGAVAGTADDLEILITQCKTAASEEKANGFRSAIIDYRQCISDIFDTHVAPNLSTTQNKNATQRTKDAFTGFCSQKNDISSCYFGLIDGVSPCLEKAIQEHVNSTKHGVSQLIDHGCGSLPELIADNGLNCIVEKAEFIGECISEGIAGTSFFNFIVRNSDEKCGKIKQTSKCISDELTLCGPKVNKTFETFFQDLLNTFACVSDSAPTSTTTALPLV